MKRTLLLRTSICFILAASYAHAGAIYLFNSGNATNNAQLESAITGAGHSATLGVQWFQFDGSISLAGFDAVVFVNNYNWNAAAMMPSSGQTQLVDFVKAGGGMLTTEWTVWNSGATNRFDTLRDVLPVVPTSAFNSAGATTYTEVTPDPVLNVGLPGAFSFSMQSISGTETQFTPRSGATTFYSSSNGGGSPGAGGLVGWSVVSGRVLSFSSLAGITEMNDSSYASLFANSVDWVAGVEDGAPVPEPATMILMGIGALALALKRRRALE